MTYLNTQRRSCPTRLSFVSLLLVPVMLAGCGGLLDSPAGSPTGGTAATGGAASTGGTAETGGTPSTGGSAATGNTRACTSDSDCTQCTYIAAPTNSNDCDGALGCCGGQVMNISTCAANQAAWEANCANRGYTFPNCPCLSCGFNCKLSCLNGQCGFW